MADIADADLPVFPFRVNWKNGISERLEWKTDILTDLVGNEQRRGLRLTPRREFEVTLTVWEQERSFLDLWLHRMVGSEFLFPLWHDSVRTPQSAAQGQKTIWLDTEGLEFGIGSYALLRGLTALSWERVQIAEVHPDRIVTVEDLVNAWPKGTRVEPLIRGWMTEQSRTNLVTSRASETQIELHATRAQYYSAGADTADQYLGLSVLTQQPNRTDSLDAMLEWSFHDSDSQTGRRFRKSEVGRAMAAQKHSWFLKGRTAKAAFRSLLYRLQGSLKPVWLPTFNEDLTLAQNAAMAATSIYVKATGFAYTGGPTSGREHILIETTAGRIYRKVTGTAAAPAGQERLVLDLPLPGGLLMSSVRRISWIDTARLQNDRIEFNHINAADGLSTVSSIFKTFRNERVPATVLSAPIPSGVMTNARCGEDVPLCYSVPTLAEFAGWFLKLRYVIQNGNGLRMTFSYNGQPNSPAGASHNVYFTPQVGNWIVGQLSNKSTTRPVQGEIFYNDGDPYVPNMSASKGTRELTYWNSNKAVVDTFAAVDELGELRVSWQVQHGSGSIKSGTRAWHEYLWWDGVSDDEWGGFARVTKGMYDTAETDVEADGTWLAGNLWPKTHVFTIPR